MTEPVTPALPASTGAPAVPAAATPAAPAPASVPAAGEVTPPEGPINSSQDGGSGPRSDAWITPEVRKAIDFDPFTPEGEEQKIPAAVDPNAPPAAVVPGAPAAVVPPVAPPTELESLRAERDRLLNAVIANQPGATPPAGVPAGAPAAPVDVLATVPEYNYTVPDQLVTALNSEDPAQRKVAIAGLIKGVAQGIHQTLAQAVIQRLTQLEASIPDAIANRMRDTETTRSVEADFYGKYPQLKGSPQMRAFVQLVGAAQMKETNNYTWSPELRDAIGNRVLATLQGVLPAPAPAAAVVPPPGPPVMFGGSANGNPRAAAAPGPKTQLDHMQDIFQ